MTEKQRITLLMAIDQAKGFRRCSYIHGCVIAQLVALEEPEREEELFATEISARKRTPLGTCPNVTVLHYYLPKDTPEFVADYPMGLLIRVQEEWDGNGQSKNADAARWRMRDMVRDWR